MKDHALKNSVTRIAMPRIGCGLDRLDWEIVSQKLKEIFDDDSGIDIDVYSIE